ncbi:MAG: pantetheine-phosphate adenylyltransferase [Bacteroidales bacterium]|nr:pantetheine-phosphate adenylyltransferase [Bacteroidales bacterium]
MKTALFPGSFDPFTLGHESVVRRGLTLFDHIVIVIGVNPGKRSMFTAEKRRLQIEACFVSEPRVEVCVWDGLTVDLAREKGAGFILRSVRSVADYEYERNMAQINGVLSGQNIQTVFFLAEPGQEALQSSIVRELLSHGHDVSAFVPQAVLPLLEESNQIK